MIFKNSSKSISLSPFCALLDEFSPNDAEQMLLTSSNIFRNRSASLGGIAAQVSPSKNSLRLSFLSGKDETAKNQRNPAHQHGGYIPIAIFVQLMESGT
jgi:hypothetical protein